MPEGIEEYYARIDRALDAGARLPLDEAAIPLWDIFPFEAEGLRLKPLRPPAEAEEPRAGEGGRPCQCESADPVPDGVIWEDESWRLLCAEPSGSPLVCLLLTKEHHGFTDLPDRLAAQMGRLMVHLGAAIEALPSVGRVHMSRWGDGGAHLHVFFIARPARMAQLRGTCMALWDDFLPPVPVEVRDENARFVVERLVSAYGGAAVQPTR